MGPYRALFQCFFFNTLLLIAGSFLSSGQAVPAGTVGGGEQSHTLLHCHWQHLGVLCPVLHPHPCWHLRATIQLLPGTAVCADVELSAVSILCLNLECDPTREQARFQVLDQHMKLQLLPSTTSHLLPTFGLAGALPFTFSALPILFLPLKLLLNIIPCMYSHVFFQAEAHFIVSCSYYFLLLCRSLSIISLSSVGFAALPCIPHAGSSVQGGGGVM